MGSAEISAPPIALLSKTWVEASLRSEKRFSSRFHFGMSGFSTAGASQFGNLPIG